MNDKPVSTVTCDEAARIIAELMPEFLALKRRLRAESPNVRRAIANALSEWAFDRTADMSAEEKRAFISSVKAELARRGEPIAVKRSLN